MGGNPMSRNLLFITLLLSAILLFSACGAQPSKTDVVQAQNDPRIENTPSSNSSTETSSPENKPSASAPVEDLSPSAPVIKTYTYLHDCWNLYIATALSDNVIKIENWYRFSAGDNPDPFKYRRDVTIVSTNDSSTGFQWLDSDHSAFYITMQDADNSYWEEASTVGFSQNDKPTESITLSGNPTYTYRNDNWNQYIATVISEEVIKIEVWDRFRAGKTPDPFRYDHDICLVNTKDPECDFKWLDENHTAFSVTMIDNENSYWEETHPAFFSANTNFQESSANDANTVFTFLNDRWDLYVGVALSPNIIKIEQWDRFDASEGGDPFTYVYDVLIINADQTELFQWIDEASHSAFLITMQDPENSYWEEVKAVSFAICPNFAELYLLPLQTSETASPEP